MILVPVDHLLWSVDSHGNENTGITQLALLARSRLWFQSCGGIYRGTAECGTMCGIAQTNNCVMKNESRVSVLFWVLYHTITVLPATRTVP